MSEPAHVQFAVIKFEAILPLPWPDSWLNMTVSLVSISPVTIFVTCSVICFHRRSVKTWRGCNTANRRGICFNRGKGSWLRWWDCHAFLLGLLFSPDKLFDCFRLGGMSAKYMIGLVGVVWFIGVFTSHATIFSVIYVTAQMCRRIEEVVPTVGLPTP